MEDQGGTVKRLIEELAAVRGELAKERSIIASMAGMERNLNETMHNLLVHQEELRTQNEDLIQARKELDASHRKYHDLFNLAPIGFFTLNPSLEILEVNLAGAKLLGKSVDQLRHKPLNLYTDKRQFQRLKAHFGKVFAGIEDEIEMQIVSQAANGYSFVLLNSGPIFSGKGIVKQCLAAMVDIEERKQAELELVKAKDEAELANRAKSVFLSSMSHEIRTPLTSIIGFSELLLTDPVNPMNQSQRAMFNKIMEASNHLLELVDDILDLSKIESGGNIGEAEVMPVQDIIRIAMASNEQLAHEYGVNMKLEAHSGDFFIEANRAHLHQAVSNLLSNGIKYNGADGQVVISAKIVNEIFGRISVFNTGQGIPEHKQGGLFKPFERLGKEGQNIPGTGIGLTIVKRLVEIMGGEVGVQSSYGEGATFYINIPISSKTPTAGGAMPIARLSFMDKSRGGPVLLIEDNEDNLFLVERLLKEWRNVDILSAADGKTGVELALSLKPRLILLDIGLPNLNGYEVLKILKSSEEIAGVPVVAITANAMKHEIELGKRAGFDEYITKPIITERLIGALDRFL